MTKEHERISQLKEAIREACKLLNKMQEEVKKLINLINAANSSTSLILDKDLELTVTEAMLKLGIKTNLNGYNYLRHAIMLTVINSEIVNSITKTLYPKVAEYFNTTPSKVERCIRHSIEKCWNDGNLELIHDIFGYTVSTNKGRPTNSEFITLIADRIRLKTI